MYTVTRSRCSVDASAAQEWLRQRDERERRLLCIPRDAWHTFDTDNMFMSEDDALDMFVDCGLNVDFYWEDVEEQEYDTYDGAEQACKSMPLVAYISSGELTFEVAHVFNDTGCYYERGAEFEGRI